LNAEINEIKLIDSDGASKAVEKHAYLGTNRANCKAGKQ
jgi:hypothetical protein